MLTSTFAQPVSKRGFFLSHLSIIASDSHFHVCATALGVRPSSLSHQIPRVFDSFKHPFGQFSSIHRQQKSTKVRISQLAGRLGQERSVLLSDDYLKYDWILRARSSSPLKSSNFEESSCKLSHMACPLFWINQIKPRTY